MLAFTGLVCFRQRLDALRAQELSHHLTILEHPDVLDIRAEEALCPPLGVADVVPHLGSFAAVFTLRHDLACLIHSV